MSTSLLVGLIALGGVLVAQLVLMWQGEKTRRNARREELLREVRWAAELASDTSESKKAAGVAALRVFAASVAADPDIQDLIRALMNVLVEEEIETYTEFTEYEEEEIDDQLGGR